MMNESHTPVFLMTDFGLEDIYVGVMRAVIAGIDSSIPIHDLTHGVLPQDVLGAGIALEDALPYLPKKCVLCAVVDPGVGTGRRSLVAMRGQQIFIAPDNGLLTPLLRQPNVTVWNLCQREAPASSTFHGRDVYAPAAARAAIGLVDEITKKLEATPLQLDLPQPVISQHQIELCVLAEDQFGNVATNLRQSDLPAEWSESDSSRWQLQIEETILRGLSRTFQDKLQGQGLFYWSSANRLELAVNQGHAAETFELDRFSPMLLVRPLD